jgi:hypothetical protein
LDLINEFKAFESCLTVTDHEDPLITIRPLCIL